MGKNLSMNWIIRYWMIGIGLVMMIGFAIIIFIQWSPVGSDRIYSLSGRYMIPIFPLFFLAVPPILNKNQSVILWFAKIVIVFSLFYGVFSVFYRYY